MAQDFETRGRAAVANLATKQPHELLLMLGGALAILLSTVIYGLLWSQGISANQVSGATTTFLVNLVLGGALLVSSVIARKNLMNAAIVAGVVSVILVVYGGRSGAIGGVVGFLGAIVAAATPYMPWLRRT